jgi:hypothetical protein
MSANHKAAAAWDDYVSQQQQEKIEELERELNAANERIPLLIAERDTARRQADQNYKLREEFLDLIGTDDVEQGVAVVREMNERIKRLEEAGDAMVNEGWNEPHLANAWRKAKEAKL